MYDLTQPMWVWGVLFFNGFLWPHLALWLASRADDPMRFEQVNLRFDAFMGGIWIGMMGLNSLPSVLIISMMGMNNIAAGGLRLFCSGTGYSTDHRGGDPLAGSPADCFCDDA
ncbi:hypothetical protein OS21_20280 [Dickeya oryzae]